MDYKKTNAPLSTVTRNLNDLDGATQNIYQTVKIAAKRANQISVEMKQELNRKLEEFASYTDNLEEVFENPEQFGYRLLFKSLEEHRRAFYARHWSQYLNYETVEMNRETIAKASNNAILKLAELKYERGKLSEKELCHVQEAVTLVKNGDSNVDHIVHRREELYPTKNFLKLIRLKPKTVYYFLKLLFGGL